MTEDDRGSHVRIGDRNPEQPPKQKFRRHLKFKSLILSPALHTNYKYCQSRHKKRENLADFPNCLVRRVYYTVYKYELIGGKIHISWI